MFEHFLRLLKATLQNAKKPGNLSSRKIHLLIKVQITYYNMQGEHFLENVFNSDKPFRIKGRKRSSGFLRIFTVAFLPFLTPAGGSNPAGHSLALTLPNLTIILINENTKKPKTSDSSHDPKKILA